MPRAASPASDALVCRRQLGESPRLQCPCAREWPLGRLVLRRRFLLFLSECCVAVYFEIVCATHRWVVNA
eukprot:8035961-Pyramimonas_sp.AAC.1